MAGYDLGYAAGLYAGSQTISASMGLATDAINRLGLAAEQTKAMLDSMPVAYAVTYMFGTVGSAIVIALVGPTLLRIDLVAAVQGLRGEARRHARNWAARARPGTAGSCAPSACRPGGKAVGLRAVEAEALVPDARVFVQRIRRNGTIEEATADTVLQRGRRGGGRRRRARCS